MIKRITPSNIRQARTRFARYVHARRQLAFAKRIDALLAKRDQSPLLEGYCTNCGATTPIKSLSERCPNCGH